MKIRLQQMEVAPGRPADNLETALRAVKAAREDGVAVLALPEMCLPGYLLGDEWERQSFLDECEAAGAALADAAGELTLIYGNVALDRAAIGEDGRMRKYNAFFAAEGDALLRHTATGLPFFIKLLMPNYREFDDNRYFFDPRKLAYERGLDVRDLIEPVASRHGRLGCMLCEDGWDQDYNLKPAEILVEKGAEVLLNLSASPFTFDKNHKRNRVFGHRAAHTGLALGYVNKTGVQDNGKTVFTFDGASAVYGNGGALLASAPSFKAAALDFDPGALPAAPLEFKRDSIATLYEALAFGIPRFMDRLGIGKVVIGVSGGVDSAVAAALYGALLPKDKLLLVSMPGPFTSQTTLGLARGLAQALDVRYTEIPIGPATELTRAQLTEAGLPISDFVYENIQARDRSARILAAAAAAFGGVFTCNANKTEMTVGYSTLYGDLSGFLAALGDLWKAEIYELARFLNDSVHGREIIPAKTLTVKPSAELSANHNVDEDKGDPLIYPYHDKLFASWVERWDRATPEDNLRWYMRGELNLEIGFEEDLSALFPSPTAFIKDLEQWWNLYQGMAIAKRIQAPPVLAVKRRAFGFDHREAQLGPRYSPAYLRMKKEVLGA